MKKYAVITIITAFFIILNIQLARASVSDIAISEILFDPVGTDTGLEYLVVKNFGNTNINMTGWDLYPDGIGYFTFPNFSLGAGKSVKITLRASGVDDEANLHHSVATGNMGNSSGSVAIFSSTTHSKDTIISFVRYQKSGSTERKTWESTAASAGLWTAETFVDVSSATEGQVIALKDFAQKTNVQSWSLASSENTQSPPAEQNTNPGTNNTNIAPDLPSSVYYNPLPPEKMKAYAGKDITILVGAETNFVGSAEDLKGEPLEGARFLWNFGDGSTGEGKSVLHTYRFPGMYTVFMDSSAGPYSASDIIKVTVVESPLLVSEIKSGINGWIEIKNNSARTVDVSGFGISNADEKPFYMPPKTIVSPWAEVVFGADVFKFSMPSEGNIVLLYPNGSVLLRVLYKSSSLADGDSLNWTGSEWIVAKATPGEKNNSMALATKTSVSRKTKTATIKNNSIAKASVVTNTKNMPPNTIVDLSDYHSNQLSASVADTAPKRLSGYLWLIVGAGGGIFAGLVFLFIKRFIT